jgi:hypothetical protein
MGTLLGECHPIEKVTQQKIVLLNSKITSITYERLYLRADSIQDYYNYKISFLANDSILVINYKSQAPILNKRNQPVLFVMEKHCMLEIGNIYSLTLTKKCVNEAKNTFYSSNSIAIDKEDCSIFMIRKNESEEVIPSFHSKFFDFGNSLYEITEFKDCDAKYSRFK